MTATPSDARTAGVWPRAAVAAVYAGGAIAMGVGGVSLVRGAPDLVWVPVGAILFWAGQRTRRGDAQALLRGVRLSAVVLFVWAGLSYAPWGASSPPAWLGPAGYPAARALFLTSLLSAWLALEWWGREVRATTDWQMLAVVALLVAGRVWPLANWVDVDYLLTDEGTMLATGMALLDGERLYVDRFEFLWPGAFLLAAAVFALTARSLLAIRVTLTVLIVLSAVLSYDLMRRVAGRGAALVGVFLIATALSPWSVYWSHHWITTATGMVAVWCLARDVPARRGAAFGAGLAAGVTMLCLQHKGAGLLACLLGAYGLLLLEALYHGSREDARRYARGLAWIVAGVAAVIGPMFAWFAAQGTLGPFHYATWTWLFEGYGPANRVPVTLLPAAVVQAGLSLRLPLALWRDGTTTVAHLAPLGFLAAALVLLLPASAQERRRWWILLAGCVGIFSATLLRYQYLRLVFVAPATCLLLAAGVSRVWALGAGRRWWGRLVQGAAGLLIVGLLVRTTAGHARYVSYLPTWGFAETAVGPLTVASFGRRNLGDMVEALWFMEQLPPDAECFVYPLGGGYYLLTGRRNPTRYFFMLPGYNRPWQVQDVVDTLDARQVAYVIWDRHYTQEWMRGVYPARPPDSFENNMIIDYVHAHYRPVLELETVTVYERTAAAGA